LAARRLLKLLPGGLDSQRALADTYAEATERAAASDDAAASDPLLAALAAAEEDDEPLTDEQRKAASRGWEEYERGETIPWEDVRRALVEEHDGSAQSASK
jgi:hypothetical protein